MSQDTTRVACDFADRILPGPREAFTIVVHLECLGADGGPGPVLHGTIRIHFTVDPATGIIRHGLFRVGSDADVDLVVT